MCSGPYNHISEQKSCTNSPTYSQTEHMILFNNSDNKVVSTNKESWNQLKQGIRSEMVEV